MIGYMAFCSSAEYQCIHVIMCKLFILGSHMATYLSLHNGGATVGGYDEDRDSSSYW